MSVAVSEIVVKGKPGVAETGVMATLRRHSPQATVLEKWDHSYLAGIPVSTSVRSLTVKSAPLRSEPEIAESAPVLYVLPGPSRLKSGAAVPVESPQQKLAAMRIVTRNVLVSLPNAADGARIRQATNATAGAPAGTGDWWLFDYATPLDALDAAIWISETAKLECTPVFERMRFKKAGPSALTPNDPLFASQWHLGNATHGINVTGAWDTWQGTGRNLLVIDDGVQLNHPDLSANAYSIASGNHFDFNGNDSDPSPSGTSENHGTACAGLAVARGNNGVGTTGVAFLASLMAIRLIAAPPTDLNERDAFTWKPALTDVSTNSWGASDNFPFGYQGPGPLAISGLQTATSTGRGGRGVVFVFPAGNGRNTPTRPGFVSDDESNYDGYANSRYVTAVGAVTDLGQQAFYSENGANVAVVAPSNGGNAGLTTVDRTGASGYDAGDYTSSFGGTSGATPIVAGVAVLLLQANSSLGWRDVKEILMRSASRTSLNLNGADPFATNGAGLQFSNSFGAGRVNAGAAIALAAGWTNLGPETSVSSAQNGINLPLPDNNATGVVRSFDMSGQQDLRVEGVELTINVTHGYRGDLRFIVTAPSGMQSLVEHRVGDNAAVSQFSWTFSSVSNSRFSIQTI